MNTTQKSDAKADAAAAEYQSSKPAPSKRKRSGRPKGSTTAERVSVKKIISREACPHCGCKREPTNKRLRHEGKASGECLGQKYGYFRHYVCNCAGCGLAFNLSEYEPA